MLIYKIWCSEKWSMLALRGSRTVWRIFNLSSPGNPLGIPAALKVLIFCHERFVTKRSNKIFITGVQSTLCHCTHQTPWEVPIVLGARRQQGAAAAGSGGCFDPRLTYFIMLLCLMLCLSFIVAGTSSLSGSSPLRLSFPFYFAKTCRECWCMKIL